MTRNERRSKLRAFMRGRKAAYAGASVADNPYPEESFLSARWLYGLAVGLAEIANAP